MANPVASGPVASTGQPMQRIHRMRFFFPASDHITSEYGYLISYAYLPFLEK